MNAQYKNGAITAYIGIAVNIIAALLYTPWMLRAIGADDYGLYSLAYSVINLFLIDFGMSSAVSMFVSKYRANNDQEKINQFLGVVFRLYLFITAAITIALIGAFFFLDQIYASLSVGQLAKFKIVYIIAACYSVFSFPFSTTLNSILTSYEKYAQLKLFDLITKILTIALIVFALLTGGGLYALVAVNASAGVMNLAAKYVLVKTRLPMRIDMRFFSKSILKQIFSLSMWTTVSTVCSRLIFNIVPSILAMVSGSAAITLFSLASTLESYTYVFSSALDGMFVPKIARTLNAENKTDSLMSLMTRVGRIQFSVITLLVVGFASVGRSFVLLWIGPKFLEIYYCTLLLILPAPFWLSQQIAKNAIILENKARFQAYINIGKAVVNIIFSLVLAHYFGALGACAAICAAYFLRNIAMELLYKKELKLSMSAFRKKCYLKLVMPIVLSLISGYALGYFIPAVNWLILALEVLAVGAIYFIFMWLLGWDSFEKNIIRSLRIFHTKGKNRFKDSTLAVYGGKSK